MKKLLGLVILAPALVAALIAFPAARAIANGFSHVVILHCLGNLNNAGNYRVVEVSSTAGSPAINVGITTGDQCADALVALSAADFELKEATFGTGFDPVSQYLFIKDD